MEQSNEELEVVKVDDEVDINEEKIRDDRLAEPKTRGKYFAERGRLCLGHFRDAPGQNSWFLVE